MFDLGGMVLRLVEETKGVEEIEEKVAGLVFELGRAMMQEVYTYLDLKLMGKRRRGLCRIEMRGRSVPHCFGTVKVRRRYHRDGEGKHRFLLDEAQGWEKDPLAATAAAEGKALEMASETSFRKAKKHLSFFLAKGVKHSLLHRRIKMRGSQRATEKRERIRELFSWGVLPPSQGREASRLFFGGGRVHDLPAA